MRTHTTIIRQLGLWPIIFALITGPTAPAQTYVQKSDTFNLKSNYKSLSLTSTIEQGLRKNYQEEIREKQKSITDLNWKDTKESFWFPSLQLKLTSGEQNVATVKTGNSPSQLSQQTPSGSLSLEMGDYTLFNWGKDYLKYLNDRETYHRDMRNYREQHRELKQNLILKFFELSYFQKVLELRKEHLRHASFIYRFTREKVALRKISKQEYYQARMEYLNAQNYYQKAKVDTSVAEEQMALLLADPPGTRYILSEQLLYSKLKTTYTDSVKISGDNNPSVLDAKVDVENAKRDYEVVLKENLPLPKFSLNLGAYRHYFDNNTSRTIYETEPGSSNMEIVASINATWSLTGTGGLFNTRKTDLSQLSKHLSFKKLQYTQHQTSSGIRNHYNNISYMEKQMTVLEAQTETNKKSFDIILENFTNKKTRFINFKDALNEMINSQIYMEQIKYNHLKEKILLAQRIGIEDFPGENFERLAQKKAEKN